MVRLCTGEKLLGWHNKVTRAANIFIVRQYIPYV